MIRVLLRPALCALLSLPPLASAETYSCIAYPYPPLVQADSPPLRGLVVEVVEKVFLQMGHVLKVEMLPPGRAASTMKAGEADCIFTVRSDEEHEKSLDFARQSIVPQVFYFFARRDAIATFNGDLASVRDFRIGTAHDFYYGPRFESIRSSLAIDEAPTMEQSLKKLAAGRVDLVPGNADTVASLLASPALRKYATRIVMLPTPIESAPTYIAFSKSRNLAKLRDEFDVVLKTFLASHEYNLLLAKYGMIRLPQPALIANEASECRRCAE